MTTDEPDQGTRLRPNCLITRRPLVFLTPPRSLFWYKHPWQQITHILYEHGYKVSIFQLPFQKMNVQKNIISKHAGKLQNSHIFLDSITYQNLKSELSNISGSTITVTTKSVITDQNVFSFKAPTVSRSLSYFLHQTWCKLLGVKTPAYSEILEFCTEKIWYRVLDHCVELAEIDYEKD